MVLIISKQPANHYWFLLKSSFTVTLPLMLYSIDQEALLNVPRNKEIKNCSAE
jgi:hypothetical protein